MRAAIACIWVVVGSAACDAPSAVKSEPAVEVPAPEVPAKAPAVEVPAPEVTPVPEAPAVETPLAGVGPSGAEGRVARRDAVLAVLGDGESAADLKMMASDPGKVFNPTLVDEMTPTVEVNVNTVPAVIQKDAKVKGPLDRDIIRRIVRAHINEIRHCYNQGLKRNPNLRGVVTVGFQILGTGKVGDAKLLKSSLSDGEVGACMVTAIRRWTFPKPVNEATVDVSYPFELAPAGTVRGGL